jgi:hypothetical protein
MSGLEASSDITSIPTNASILGRFEAPRPQIGSLGLMSTVPFLYAFLSIFFVGWDE